MTSRLLNLLTALSLLLCVAVVVLWAQSWLSPRSVRREWVAAAPSTRPAYHQVTPAGLVPVSKPMRRAFTLYSQWGRVQVSWGSGFDLPAPLTGFFRHAEWRPDAAHPWRGLGVYVERERPHSPSKFRYVSFPYWLPRQPHRWRSAPCGAPSTGAAAAAAAATPPAAARAGGTTSAQRRAGARSVGQRNRQVFQTEPVPSSGLRSTTAGSVAAGGVAPVTAGVWGRCELSLAGGMNPALRCFHKRTTKA